MFAVFVASRGCRFQQSSKSSSHPSTLQPGAKSESLREEMEEAANRMEICRVSHRPAPLQSHSSLPPSPLPSAASCSRLSPFDLCLSRMCPTQAGRDAGDLPPNMLVLFLFQDQLSADMYSFVAKEIDYANYFQTVSMDAMRKKKNAKEQLCPFN